MRNRVGEQQLDEKDVEHGTGGGQGGVDLLMTTRRRRILNKSDAKYDNSKKQSLRSKSRRCIYLSASAALLLFVGVTYATVMFQTIHAAKKAPSKRLSTPSTTTVTASVRGNLGPPSVVVSDSVENWLKDRWQAASDMHGTAIQGSHWVQLDFHRHVMVDKVILDWESAYSDDYQIQSIDSQTNQTTVLYDTTSMANPLIRQHKSREWGQSPGVEFKCPLHIEHTITLPKAVAVNSILQLWIRKPAKHGWGVSLWTVQVYGHEASSAVVESVLGWMTGLTLQPPKPPIEP
jgi:hypothetical protein